MLRMHIFQEKHQRHKKVCLPSAFVAQTTCSINTFTELCKYRVQETSPCHVTFVCICFDKNTVLVQYNAFAGDFTSVVLIRMLPGALNTFVLPVILLGLFCSVVPTLPLNWIR